MEIIYASNVPAWAMVPSLLAVPLIYLFGRRPNVREFWTLAAAVVKFGFVLTLLPGALEGRVAETRLLEISPGIELALRADMFGVLFAIIASGLWTVTSVYSIGYMRGNKEKKQTRYYACFALSLFSTIGVAFAANLLTFLVFYELLTLATYPLVIHKETKESIRSGRMYLTYALTAGVLLIAASGWVYQATGTLDFKAGGVIAPGLLDPGAMKILFVIFIAAVGVKAGVMPLHSWLPAAMVAPTPVSALLHAVAVVKSGVFGIVRVVGYVFGPETMGAHNLDVILATAAGATIILASLIAIKQDNLKARLAYSTVGHLSYIVLGCALLSAQGFTGGILHISAHAAMKITLFFCAGAIYVHTHKTRVSELDGIGRAMPWTMGAFAIGSMGLAGIPPINGFVSKWFLCLGSIESGNLFILGIFLASGLLNAAYFFPVVHRAFFKPAGEFEGMGEASLWMVAPLCVTAALSVLFGIVPDWPLHFHELAGNIASALLDPAAVPTLGPALTEVKP